MDQKRIENAIREILIAIGDNPDREGIIDTPKRVAKMYAEVFSGIQEDPRKHLEVYFEEEQYEEIVLVKDIPFYSMCEHHLLPFYGIAHIAYIPREGRLTGLSKLARILDTIAKRPQLQERITKTIADHLEEVLDPLGVFVAIEAEHMCMTMRGIKKPGSKTMTSTARGIFKTDPSKRAEVLSLIK